MVRVAHFLSQGRSDQSTDVMDRAFHPYDKIDGIQYQYRRLSKVIVAYM